jgi:Fe-Mn family superoxide dismutase
MTTFDQPRAPFALPALPYEKTALAPHLSAETVDFHYGKHFQTYINNLNNLIAGTEFEGKSLEQIVRSASGPVFNNAAQAWNHAIYFMSFSAKPQTAPTGALAEAINRDFGSLESFKEQFAKSAIGLFGSGWTWLVKNAAGNLEIVNTSNAGNPMTDGKTPLMVIDVWEHAYYIDYRNVRAESVKAFWNIVNWKIADERFGK